MEQAQLSRVLHDSKVATAMEVRNALRCEFAEEWCDRVAGLQESHQRSRAEVVEETGIMAQEVETTSVALRHSHAEEQALSRKLAKHSFALTWETGVMESRLAHGTAMIRSEARAAQEEIASVKTFLLRASARSARKKSSGQRTRAGGVRAVALRGTGIPSREVGGELRR